MGITMVLLIIIIFSLSFIILIIQLNSSGKPAQYIDNKGKVIKNSISEKGFFQVNGVKLAYFIKSRNINNPVLLYLHGGMPDYFLSERYPTGLDEVFTVVWLDQRGAGLSFEASFPNKSNLFETLISDIKETTLLLEKRFSQNKIFLMGHSGGTYLGVKVIERYPELFKAYIGVAQISYQKLSEMKAYDYIKTQYVDNHNKKSLYDKLIQYPVEIDKPIPKEYALIRDTAMHDLGVGTMHTMNNVITGLFIPSLLFKEYSFIEKIILWRGKANSGISIIWDDLMRHNLAEENTSFKIPIYFFHGVYDYTCSYELSKDYFNIISAPRKMFFAFNNSAHSPIFEEPNECVKIIKENILNAAF